VKILKLHVFLVEKNLANRDFENIEARLIVDGLNQE
jgi:hypothetical protein